MHPCDSSCHNAQARSFKRCKDASFLPKPSSEEKAYTSEALTRSLGLYKQKYPAAARASIADDLLVSMEQVRFCTSPLPSLVLQVHHWTVAVPPMPLVCSSMISGFWLFSITVNAKLQSLPKL